MPGSGAGGSGTSVRAVIAAACPAIAAAADGRAPTGCDDYCWRCAGRGRMHAMGIRVGTAQEAAPGAAADAAW